MPEAIRYIAPKYRDGALKLASDDRLISELEGYMTVYLDSTWYPGKDAK